MEKKEVLVKVEGLSKKFSKDLKTSLWYGIKDLFLNLGGEKKVRELRPTEFWALQDINFELKRGECLGLIGHNGAGKSTLLKILNGLISPDAGKVTIKGRVGALIELGAGFNPILTGRENIYNNGAVLGFTKAEITNKIETIIDFAEIRDFIDMPVQNYSSGMKVRLGFAVAAQMEPDVLIIDEVLAVGDLGFTIKCFRVIDNILPNTAIIFVSHSMPLVSRICTKIALLEKGVPKYFGNDVAKAIDLYYSRFKNVEDNIMFNDGTLNLVKAELIRPEDSNEVIDSVKRGEDIVMNFKFQILKMLEKIPVFTMVVLDKEQRPIAYFDNNTTDSHITINNKELDFLLIHKKNQFSKGVYSIDIMVKETLNTNIYLNIKNVLTFQVEDKIDIFPSFLLNATYEDKNEAT